MEKDILTLILDQLTGLNKKLVEHDTRFNSIDERFVSMDRKFDAIDRRFDSVEKRLDDHDGKLDRIIVKLVGHDIRFQKMNERMDGFATKEDIRMLQTGIDVLALKTERLDEEFAVLSGK